MTDTSASLGSNISYKLGYISNFRLKLLDRFLTLSGPPGGGEGGSEARMTKFTAAIQKPFSQ